LVDPLSSAIALEKANHRYWIGVAGVAPVEGLLRSTPAHRHSPDE